MPSLRLRDAQDVLLDADTYGTTLLVWSLDTLGPELLDWHPAVVRREVEEAARVPLADAQFDRLMAAIAVLTTDLFFKNAQAFGSLANALCGDGFRPAEFDPPEAVECAWAATEALLLDPPDEDAAEDAIFGAEVRAYIGAILRREGFLRAPDILALATGLDPARVLRDWGGDPDAMARIERRQAELDAEVRDAVQAGLSDLVGQLAALPLRHGDARDLTSRFRLRAERAEAGTPKRLHPTGPDQ